MCALRRTGKIMSLLRYDNQEKILSNQAQKAALIMSRPPILVWASVEGIVKINYVTEGLPLPSEITQWIGPSTIKRRESRFA